MINNLTNEHEVYTLDLLGYGLSEKPAITYTNNLFEQLVTDFIKNVIGKKTSVIASGKNICFQNLFQRNVSCLTYDRRKFRLWEYQIIILIVSSGLQTSFMH